MSLFARLYNILRSQLQTGDAARPNWQPPDADFAKPGGGPTPGQDPELAGYYANLEAPYGADLETVRKAWKRLAQQYHPDKHAANPEAQRAATELFKAINLAYEKLEKHLKKEPPE